MLTSPSQEAKDRADLWTDWVRVFGKSVRTDVAFQFAPGQQREPTAARYKRDIERFLAKYGDKIKIGSVAPWNEPQFEENPTDDNPLRAARFWVITQQLCHPKAGTERCGNVVAGEYAGTNDDLSYKLNPKATAAEKRFKRTRKYERDYRAYLYSELEDAKRATQGAKRRAPFVWGFHAYGDLRTYHYRPDGRARISERYFRNFRSDRYRTARVWMTAAGSYYRQPCRLLTEARITKHCKEGDKPRNPNGILLFGERVQANALALLLRRMSLHLRDDKNQFGKVERFYYYHLRNVSNASTFGGPADVLGRSPQKKENWGLVGDASDTPEFPQRADVYEFENTMAFSVNAQRRLIFCTLKNRSISKVTASTKCPTPQR